MGEDQPRGVGSVSARPAAELPPLLRNRERRSSAGPLTSGAAAAAAAAAAAVKGQPVAKCVLTLDGYSYVIGKREHARIFLDVFVRSWVHRNVVQVVEHLVLTRCPIIRVDSSGLFCWPLYRGRRICLIFDAANILSASNCRRTDNSDPKNNVEPAKFAPGLASTQVGGLSSAGTEGQDPARLPCFP